MVKLIALLKRKPGMTPEEFAQRWVYEHTKISSRLPSLKGYRINIATPRQPAGTGDEPLYDGTAELWWDSIEEMEASFDTELGQLAGSDGDSFTTVRLHVYTEEYNIVPGPGEPPPIRQVSAQPDSRKSRVSRVKRASTSKRKPARKTARRR